jgi:penicillin-binding protein activator
MLNALTRFGAIASLSMILVACGGPPKVERTDTDTTVDLSGNWNDADSRMVAKEMIQDMVEQGWYARFSQAKKKGGVPVVTVGTMENLSSEHIETNAFVADIQRAAVNSGRLRFIASNNQVREIRRARNDQELNASEKTRKAAGNELGADVALQGKITTINDYADRESVKFYQVDLVLTDIETSEILWQGQKKIKKLVTKSRFR